MIDCEKLGDSKSKSKHCLLQLTRDVSNPRLLEPPANGLINSKRAHPPLPPPPGICRQFFTSPSHCGAFAKEGQRTSDDKKKNMHSK